MKNIKVGNIIYQSSNEDIMPLGGLPLVSELIRKSGIDKAVNKIPFRQSSKRSLLISNASILRSMLGLLVQGYSDYANIKLFYDSDFFGDIMNIPNLPSEETLRQRLDAMGKNSMFFDCVDNASLSLLSSVVDSLNPSYKNYIPVDMDVSPLDNSDTKKEGVSCTYKLHDGYAPMFMYIGQEGYMLGCELCEGKQHSQTRTPEFLSKMLERVEKLKIKNPLFRFDSGNDSEDNIKLIQDNGYDFLIKRNPRRSKEAWVNEVIEKTSNYIGERKDHRGRSIRIYQNKSIKQTNDKMVYIYTEVREILEEANGQLLFIPEYELESYISSLDETLENIKEVYHQHGICEQFHSELKSDMGVERLPSGKFATNDLILHLAMMAYNILQIIG